LFVLPITMTRYSYLGVVHEVEEGSDHEVINSLFGVAPDFFYWDRPYADANGTVHLTPRPQGEQQVIESLRAKIDDLLRASTSTPTAAETPIDSKSQIHQLADEAMKLFRTPIVKSIVKILEGNEENLKNIRYFSCGQPGGRPSATFASDARIPGPCVVVLSSLVHALSNYPEDVHLRAYFIIKLLHEFMHLCHRSYFNPHDTPKNFKCARTLPPTAIKPRGVEAGRWLEEEVFGGWIEPLRMIQPPSADNRLGILVDSWNFPIADDALKKLTSVSEWEKLPQVEVKPHAPLPPTGRLLTQLDFYPPNLSCRFSSDAWDLIEDPLWYHCVPDHG
jgi:hypothetical protein